METRSGRVAAKDILNASNFDNYMYPSRYNEEHEMTRFFSFQFISGAEVTEDINWNVKSESIDADGIIYGIIPENEEQIKILTEIIKTTSRGITRCVFVIPRHFMGRNKRIPSKTVISEGYGGRNRTRTCDPIDVNDVLNPCAQCT